jgi:hypothetical protein
MLVCGLESADQDVWWPPCPAAGPFLLKGFHGTILADDPLTAIKAKIADFGKQVLAVGPETIPRLVAPFLVGGPLKVAAKDEAGRERLETFAGLLSRVD